MSISGTGVDIIEIDRIERAIARFGERLLKRLFTERELKYATGKSNPYPSLAARFAAKEAFIKALSPVGSALSLNEIELVAEDGRRKPGFNFYGHTKDMVASAGIDEIQVSVSHSRAYAVATVILENLGSGLSS